MSKKAHVSRGHRPWAVRFGSDSRHGHTVSNTKGIAATIPFVLTANGHLHMLGRMIRRNAATVLFLVLWPMACACERAEPSRERSIPQTLVIPEYQVLIPLNPLATTTLSARLVELIFDGLTRLDERLEVQPHLAVRWTVSEDHRTWRFDLRQGVQFHDGAELTAEDVQWTFDWLRALPRKSAYSYAFHQIDRVAATEKYAVEISLREPRASFLGDLRVGILPRHFLEKYDLTAADFHTPIVGTGPFKVKRQSEREIVLDANEEYFLGRPALDQIVATVYPNQESAWAGLMRNEVGFFPFLVPTNYDLLTQVSTVARYSVLKPYYYVLMFNTRSPFFQDRRVRQALNYAVNKEEIVAKILRERGRVAAGTIYPNSWAYDPATHPYAYDPRKALAMLSAAGWRDHDGDHLLDRDGRLFKFTVYTNRGDDVKQQSLLLIQRELFDLGIVMEVNVLDAAGVEILFQKQFEMVFLEMDAGGDPDLSYKFWHSSQARGGFNFGSYRNPTVDRLLEAGRRAFDRADRKTIYARFQRELFDDPPGIFLFWTDYLVGVNERIKGVKISPAGPFANIHEWSVEN
ncbi:MAG: ABC transporter substrate-binding protein [Nitrospirota bacterium]